MPRMQPISNEKKLVEYQALVERDGELCAWCGRGPTPEIPLSIDHIDPDGGEALDNKQLLCIPCNSQKGNATEDKTVRWVSAVWQRGFTMIPNIVLASDALGVYAFRVYSLLLYFARQDDACWPGQAGMAKLSKCSDRQVRESLRELEAAGLVRTRRRGRGETNVYILLVPRAARGSALGLNGSEAGSAQDRQEVPPNKKQLNKTSSSTTGRLPGSVGGMKVTAAEHDLVDGIMAALNEAWGTKFAGSEWRTKIVRRVREHPDMNVSDHEAMIRQQTAHPWWKGDPSPSVIYGNGATFDRARNGVRGGKPDEPVEDLYTRA